MIGAVVGAKGAVELLLPRLFSLCGAPTHKIGGTHGVLLGWGAARSERGVVIEATVGAPSLDEEGNSSTLRFGEGGVRLGRGSLGAPSLYFGRHPSGVWIALSRFAPLATMIESSLNDVWLASAMLSFNYPAPLHSARVGISRVADRASTHLSLSEGPRSFDWPSSAIPVQRGSSNELAEELWSQVRRSVAAAIEGHVRIAVMVGGGVDSSGMLAAAIAETRGASAAEVLAIALDFDGPGSDRPHLTELCKELGVVPIRTKPAFAGKYVGRTFVLDGMPYPTLAGPWYVMMGQEARRRGATVLIDGDNGDFALNGDPRFFSRLFLRGHPFAAIFHAYRFTKPFSQGPLRSVRDYVFRPIVASMVPERLRKMRRRRARLRFADWVGKVARDHVSSLDDVPYQMCSSHEDRYDRLVRQGAGTDYASMSTQLEVATSVRIAEPLCDDRLMRFVAGIDPLDLLFGDQERGLYRLALKGEVPENLRLRPDKAEYLPAMTETIAAAGGVETLRDLSSMRESGKRGLVAPASFGVEFAKLVANPGASIRKWGELWPAFSVEAYLRGQE